MTHEPEPQTTTDSGPSPRPSPIIRALSLAVRTVQVRLRFVAFLAAALIVAGQWDTLRNYWEHWTRGLANRGGSSRAVPARMEYFCPMDPVVVSIQPGKCDICNMALVRRTIGDMAPLPSGVLSRMQISPYRVQLAGIQTAPASYRPAILEIHLDGVVRDDGMVECRVPDYQRSLINVGQPAELTLDDGPKPVRQPGKVSDVNLDPRTSQTLALILLEAKDRKPDNGRRVVATLHKSVDELDPFRSLPSNPPPRAKGELLAVYLCPQHPEVLESDRGVCPIDRDDKLRRLPLLDNQRVGWWCPMHPKVVADHPGESCQPCGGMKLIPRVVNYRPPGQVLTVPESALVDTGTRTIVFVERSPGLFDAVEVVVGPRSGDVYPVVSGLQPGQNVAIRGAFLLDAETRLNPSLAAGYFGANRSTRLETSDSPTEPANGARPGLCPVTGYALGSMGPAVSVVVDGQTVELCCKACEAPLRQAPEKYLSRTKPR